MTDFAASCYLPDGTLDSTFGAGGRVIANFQQGPAGARGVVLDDSNRIVAAGSVSTLFGSEFAIVRWLPNGVLDASFSGNGQHRIKFPEGNATGTSLAIDGQGRIVVAGRVSVNGKGRFAVTRSLENGDPDLDFGTGGRVATSIVENHTGMATAVAIDSRNRIIAAGFTNTLTGNAFALVRYLEDGHLDTTFGGDGRVVVAFQGRDNGLITDEGVGLVGASIAR
jgi:uncharacterized delta-60 repeat protein